MTSKRLSAAMAAAMLAAAAIAAHADDRTEYNRRAAARDLALFQSLDRNSDGVLARDETRGDLNLGPRFDDIDINRDGVISPDELQRYFAERYGVRAEAPAR